MLKKVLTVKKIDVENISKAIQASLISHAVPYENISALLFSKEAVEKGKIAIFELEAILKK